MFLLDTTVTQALPRFVTHVSNRNVYDIKTRVAPPPGRVEMSFDFMKKAASGDLFRVAQNHGMGWDPKQAFGKDFMVLSTCGGLKPPEDAEDQRPDALGLHTGHYEIIEAVRLAANFIATRGAIPYAAFVSDPCDGRTMGTDGMMDSLPYRNDAAMVLRRLYRSLPTARGVMGVATCDKGLPAMMMALAGIKDAPGIIVPGGVSVLPEGHEGSNAQKVQTASTRLNHKLISLPEAQDEHTSACPTCGGGCQFLGTAATSQVVAEALGLTLPHTALAPSGQDVWKDNAIRSAEALLELEKNGLKVEDILTEDAFHNAMIVHAAAGGSTNLLLHIPAIMHAADIPLPTVEKWHEINRQIPRLLDVLPNSTAEHATVHGYMAGGVPELMLHLHRKGLLKSDAKTVTGKTVGDVVAWWEKSHRRREFKKRLRAVEQNIKPEDIIKSPARAKSAGFTSTVTFPKGNLAPEGSVIKSTAIDKGALDENGVFNVTGKAKIFTNEPAAIDAIKSGEVKKGHVVVLLCNGPKGTGMKETLQITGALKEIEDGMWIPLITDGRFSGVSTGPCIGHVGPEALEQGSPIGKLKDNDLIEVRIDTRSLEGSINLVGHGDKNVGAEKGQHILEVRAPRNDLAPDPNIPIDTKLWATLQSGTWRGCTYDEESITAHQRLAKAIARMLGNVNVSELAEAIEAAAEFGDDADLLVKLISAVASGEGATRVLQAQSTLSLPGLDSTFDSIAEMIEARILNGEETPRDMGSLVEILREEANQQ